jgi:hypothetical protein
MQYGVSLLFAFLCNFVVTRLTSFNILVTFDFLLCVFVFYFEYSVFLYCLVYRISFCIQLSLSYLCTSLPITFTGWTPNYNK